MVPRCIQTVPAHRDCHRLSRCRRFLAAIPVDGDYLRNLHLLVRCVVTATLAILVASATRAQCDNPKTDAARGECIKTELKASDSTINRTYVVRKRRG